jgi:uncharacterized metal-binding protein
VERHLTGSDPPHHIIILWVLNALLDHLSSLGCLQELKVSLIPLKNALAQFPHEYTVKLMLICGASIGKTAHEVPDIQSEIIIN